MKRFIVQIIAGDKLYDQTVVAEHHDVHDGAYLFYNLINDTYGGYTTEYVARYPVGRTIIYKITKIDKEDEK